MVEEDVGTRAKFAEKVEPRLGGDTIRAVYQALESSEIDLDKEDKEDDESQKLSESLLLHSTPPSISKTLLRLYPYLLVADDILGIVTWTGPTTAPSVLMTLLYLIVVMNFQAMVKYGGHLMIVLFLWSFAKLDGYVTARMASQPAMEDVVHVMNRVSAKFDMFFAPLVNLSKQDVRKLFYFMILFSPLYLIITVLVLSWSNLLVLAGLAILTYHSPWCKVTRRILWKFKFIRVAFYYATGLDLGGLGSDTKHKTGFLAALNNQLRKLITEPGLEGEELVHDHNGDLMAKACDTGSASDALLEPVSHNKPIRFTYVLYENQRKWIGIGWKTSMLGYERTPWTDEFLNEAPSPEQFQLPEGTREMQWRWVDPAWRVDLSNDGALEVRGARPRTTAQPGPDDGFVYYDNTWKKPHAEDSFSKYTRRRRWIRTAELVAIAGDHHETSTEPAQAAPADAAPAPALAAALPATSQ